MKNFFFIRAILLPIPRTFLICTLLFSIVNISSAQTHTPITKSIDPLIQGYWEYLPEGYNSNSNNYPLLVFFHGVGEVGNGSQTALPKVLKNGIPKLINNGTFPKKFKVNGKEYSFIVISPQIKTTDRNPQMVKALLEYCKKQYRVDESRIYITGLSQGGGTVWQLSSKGMYVIGKGFEYIANSLAAIAPICGNYPSSTESSAVLAKAGLPVWIMHNDGDNIVAPQTSKDWYNNLLANGIDPSTLLTLNHASGHDAWTKGYDPNWRPNGMNMYEWMLQYSRKSATEVTKDAPVTQPENQAPTAVINTTKTVTMPVDSLVLDGSASKDSDGSIKAYAWKLVSGPAGYTLSDSKQSKLYVTKVTAGTYNFQLTVTDDKQATGNANVNIVVNPAPNVVPVASAKAPASITLPVDSLTLDGSASYDKDGSIKQYKWELTTAPAGYIFTAANTATVKLSSLVVGSYTATLTITDNDGATASAKTSFVVNKAPNVAPVASVKAPASITLPVDSLVLDGAASYDKDGSIKQYKWELTTAPAGYSFTAANAATVKLSSLVVGSYTATLTITDNDGATASAKTSFVVNKAPNVAPVASLKAPASITLPVDSLILDGAASYDKDGSIKQYKWELTTAPVGYSFSAANTATVKLSSLVVGSYTATLTITDNDGATASAKTSFVVNKAPNVAPVASVKAPASITLPVDSLTLDGSASYDKDGSIKQYKWELTTAPAGYSFTAANAATVKLSSLVVGSYTAILTITDNDGATASAKTSFVVNKAPNVAPVASLKAPASITLPVDSLVLDGAASYDKDGSIKQYKWELTTAPVGYSFSAANTATVKLSSLVVGSYTATLTITDNDGATASAKTSFVVNKAPNVAPVASVKAPASITLPADSLTLDGAASYDKDGSIKQYKWELTTAPVGYSFSAANTAIVKLSGLVAGSYTATLTITDNDGATASAKTSFVVNKAPNVAPVASVKAPASITLPVDSLVLDGAASYDKDGSIKQYKWELTTAPVGYSFSAENTATVKLSSLVVGSYTATLTITDNDGATASAKTSFVVNKAPNVAPVASVKAPASITLPVDSLTLDGSASYDKDGSIKQYKWQLTVAPVGYSSAAANAATIKLTKLAAGSYTATLTVIDNDGATASAKVSFLVNKAANVAPVASVKAPASITLPVDSLILDGAASYDKDGSIKQYKWELTTAPASYSFTAANAATVKLSKLVAGSYAATLTVTDNAGATASAGVSFTVNEQRINTAPVAITKAPTAITLPEDSVLVDGSGSYDKDGRIAQYKWQMISGPASYILNNTTGAKLVLNKLVAGTYSIQLTVKDNDGAQDVSIVNLVVNPKPVVVEEPVTETIEAIVKGVQDITLPVNSITFDGSSSKVPGGKIKYAWKFVSGPGGYYYTHPFSPTFKIYNLSPGTRTWQLTVTDGKGNSATKQFTFTVFKQSNNRTAVNSSAATAEMALPQPAKTALNIKPGLTMAPVPAVSNMNIYLNDEATGKVTIRISDASGRVIMLKNNLDKNEATWQYNLQVSQLISGMYYCEVIIGNKKLNGKFVKVN